MTTAASSSARRRRAQRGSGEHLRAEIISATKQLLADAGHADSVSIRSVAEAVGVTTPSIYLHFADKDALIAAVVADVFAELDRAMVDAGRGIADPLQRLHAYGHAYARFALDHPEHYRVAVLDPCPTPDVDEILVDSAFTHLQETVSACMAAGIFAPGDPLPIALDLWSAVHGVVSLLIIKPFMPWGDAAARIDRVLTAAALGHAATELVGQPLTAERVAAWLSRQPEPR